MELKPPALRGDAVAKTAKNAKNANPRGVAYLAVLGRQWHSPGAPGLCIWETSRNFAKLAETLRNLIGFSRFLSIPFASGGQFGDFLPLPPLFPGAPGPITRGKSKSPPSLSSMPTGTDKELAR